MLNRRDPVDKNDRIAKYWVFLQTTVHEPQTNNCLWPNANFTNSSQSAHSFTPLLRQMLWWTCCLRAVTV